MVEQKKLRIAMFMSSSPLVVGGVQEHVYYLASELRKRGNYVGLFGSEPKSPRFKNYTPIGHTIEVPTLNGNWGNLHFLKSNLNLATMFSRDKFDILHVHEPYNPFGAWDLIQKVKLPKVASFHNAWDNNSSNNLLNTALPLLKTSFSDNVEGAIFVSDITKRRWKALCEGKVIKTIIGNGIDQEVFFPKEKVNKVVEMLFVGRLVPRKGVHYLLRAFKTLIKTSPNIHLSIMGDGAERNWCVNFINKNGLAQKVTLLGQIVGNQKIAYYQKADIFCAPYSDEAFPITILEAMSCGCTIVGFKNEAVKESLGNYPLKSLLVEQKNTNALVRAMKLAAEDKTLRNKAFRWCAKESKKYSWTKVAEDIEQIYQKAIKQYYA